MLTFQGMLYLLAVATSLACTVFLFRAYLENGQRLLLWSALCFVGLTVNNIAVFFDLVVFVELDLRVLRLGATLVGMLFLLYGFIWESE
jgi:hypothetical protein